MYIYIYIYVYTCVYMYKPDRLVGAPRARRRMAARTRAACLFGARMTNARVGRACALRRHALIMMIIIIM